MQSTINNSLLSQLKPAARQYDVRDNKLKGFLIRINPSGKMNYVCEYKRGRRINLGAVGVLTPAQARDRAKEILADVIRGVEPTTHSRSSKVYNFKFFIENEYKPWIEANYKRGAETITRIKIHFFEELGNKELKDITPWIIEKWRTKRIKNGIRTATINRDIAALKGALSRAKAWGLIQENPLTGFKLAKIDSISKIRFLNVDEEAQLYKALALREEKIKVARNNANKWRKQRGYQEMKNLDNNEFADYMRPMIFISLNTGLRKGELLNLTWGDINFSMAILTIKGETSKNNTTRHIPLNAIALSTLKAWRSRSEVNNAGLIFPNKSGSQLTDVKKSWASILKYANIQNFRWHDMRHHFASRLAMAGVDLNTVRELLGHSDIKMTLRYAHLAPEHKAEAVAKLVGQAQVHIREKKVITPVPLR